LRESASAPFSEAHHERNLVLLCRRCHARADRGAVDVPVPDGHDQWRHRTDP
jgi:hypothetical protein